MQKTKDALEQVARDIEAPELPAHFLDHPAFEAHLGGALGTQLEVLLHAPRFFRGKLPI